jgi:hypothetical protein
MALETALVCLGVCSAGQPVAVRRSRDLEGVVCFGVRPFDLCIL